MPIKIVRDDITKTECDAIVNAANGSLLGGGGVDGAIHKAAGRELLKECAKLGGCHTGEAKITKGYNLPCKYVIHTVGPIYRDGLHNEKELLESCYKNSLNLAKTYNCESVAFPLISSGVYGYPKDQALEVAVDVISNFLTYNDMLVYVVIYDKSDFKIREKLISEISLYINDKYYDAPLQCQSALTTEFDESPIIGQKSVLSNEEGTGDFAQVGYPYQLKESSLEEAISQIDESFSQMLLRKIDEIGITDAQCYKRANVDRKLFSKIRTNADYKPSKTTALAFAISLKLDLKETKDMLSKAGFALSHSNKFDIIVEYFIMHNNYNICEINEALFAFDQKLLGV